MRDLIISIPKLSLVVLIGPSGSGKSTFARKHFLPDRGPVVGRLPGDGQRRREQSGRHERSVRGPALHRRPAAGPGPADGHRRHQRAARGPQAARRAGPQVPLPARRHRAEPPRAALPGPQPLSRRNATSARTSSASSSRNCAGRSGASAGKGFRHVFVLESPEEVEAATVERVPLWNDKRQRTRPLRHHRRRSRLLRRTGSPAPATRLRRDVPWTATRRSGATVAYAHPEGRKAVFVGDLVDRGPRILDTVRLVRNMVAVGSALCVPGNHDMKLMRKLRGKDVQITHGLAESPRRDRRPAGRRSCSRSARNWPSSSTAW